MKVKFIIADKLEMHTSYQFLDSMINKMADEDDVLYLCLYSCRPRSHYHISIRISTRRTNMPVLLVLMLMLMSPVFSLAYTCGLGLCLCLRLCASENEA